jgi:hypothetical protein
VIVFGVADGDHVVRRKPQLGGRGHEPARLVDVGRQHHDRAFVEYDLQLEAQIAYRRQHERFVRFHRGDNAGSARQRPHAAALELGHE